MQGTFTWKQHTQIHFNDEAMEVEIASDFVIHSVADEYYIGNAHLFYVPPSANNITCEEYIATEGSDIELINVYSTDTGQLVRYQHPPELRVYPTIKSLEGIRAFRLIVRYELPFSVDPAKQEFTIHLDFTYFLRSYMENLHCGENETLNRALLSIHAPTDCIWNVGNINLHDQLKDQRALSLDEDLCATDAGLVKIGFVVGEAGIMRQNNVPVSFELPATLTAEAMQARIDNLAKVHEDQPGAQVVVFVCDLVGSSEKANDGKPPADLLRFRRIWNRSDVKPFRLVNIIGDMALIVCDPNSFMDAGLNEISRLYSIALELDFSIRGGFHIGLAQATGDKTEDRMTGYMLGEEFLGTAINEGCKAGDYKDNKGGLIATKEFFDWFKQQHNESAFNFWKEQAFGSWTTSIYKVEIGLLQRSTLEGVVQDAARAPVSFPDRLVDRAREINSRLIVGLDPDVNKFPKYLQQQWYERPTQENLAEIIFTFNKTIIEATKDLAVAYKPQAAFYEQYGLAGLRALQRTVCFLREHGILIILDAKRNDIAHTARAYADAWLSPEQQLIPTRNDWQVDAITINGYLGKDGIEPFLDANSEAGLFVLAKTSNQSSADLQDCKLLDGTLVYEKMALLANEWGSNDVGKCGYSRLGLVVGATYPAATKRLRELAPKALFLMPGVGAQGGPIEAVAAGAGDDKLGAYVASSRSVLYGFKPEEADGIDWRNEVSQCASKEANDLNNKVKGVLGT